MDLAQQFIVVFFVLATLCGALWWLKANGWAQVRSPFPSQGNKQLQVIERLALSPQHSVQIIRVSQKLLLVAISPAGCQLLERLNGVGNKDELC
jgi:flagellar biogenesis protein FliO